MEHQIVLDIEDKDLLSYTELYLDEAKLEILIGSSSDDSYGIGNLEKIPLGVIREITHRFETGWVIEYIIMESDPNAMVFEAVEVTRYFRAYDIIIL